jgi:murein DD-endopeptidase MepM/ murein hydrolase activator NlpD
VTRWDFFPLEGGPCAPAPDVQGGWQITSYFGGRVDPITGQVGSHGGQDLAYAGCAGACIYAPSAGTLAQGWDSTGGGNWSGVTLDDGSYIGIGHAASFAPGPSYRRVQAGELIAYCDSTGSSTGHHVHIAYRPAGSAYYADPFDLLADSQHRLVGDDMALTPEDIDTIRDVVNDVFNEKAASLYTGQRALSTAAGGMYELVRVDHELGDNCDTLARRHIPRPAQVRLLRYADALAEADATGDARMIHDPEMAAEFESLPIIGQDS